MDIKRPGHGRPDRAGQNVNFDVTLPGVLLKYLPPSFAWCAQMERERTSRREAQRREHERVMAEAEALAKQAKEEAAEAAARAAAATAVREAYDAAERDEFKKKSRQLMVRLTRNSGCAFRGYGRPPWEDFGVKQYETSGLLLSYRYNVCLSADV